MNVGVDAREARARGAHARGCMREAACKASARARAHARGCLLGSLEVKIEEFRRRRKELVVLLAVHVGGRQMLHIDEDGVVRAEGVEGAQVEARDLTHAHCNVTTM